WLEPFDPYLTGAVWKGIVAEHAPIHVQVFHDNAKEVGIAPPAHRVDYEATTTAHPPTDTAGATRPAYRPDGPVLLSLYLRDDLRGALRASGPRGAERGNRQALLARMAEADDETRPGPGSETGAWSQNAPPAGGTR